MARSPLKLIVVALAAGTTLVVPGLAAASGQRPSAAAAAGVWRSATGTSVRVPDLIRSFMPCRYS
jgi:hypothetical protein